MRLPNPRRLALLLLVPALLALSGCFEDEAEITINPDGSGTFTQTIQMSERLVVAMSSEDQNPGMGEDTPFNMSQEDLETQLGTGGSITSFETQDLDDGGKLITVKGTFDNAGEFFDTEYVADTLKLTIQSTADGNAELMWEAESEDTANGPSLDQMYGLAKGMKVVRTVTLPSVPTATIGTIDGKSVTWSMDLSNRQTLDTTKTLVAQAEDGVLTASFDPGTIDFDVAPAPPAATTDSGVSEDGVAVTEQSAAASGLAVKVVAIRWTKVKTLGSDAMQEDPSLDLQLELTWPKDSRPTAYYGAELLSLSDNTGQDLVIQEDNSFGNSRQDVWEHSDNSSLNVSAIGPEAGATKLVDLEGQVRVVTKTNVETIDLDNPAELVGKASSGNASLDKLGFNIEEIDGSNLKLRFNDEVSATDVIESLTVTLPDGKEVESNGWGGWANQMNYSFPEDIATMTGLRIELLAGETVVTVPFSANQIELP